MQTTVSSGQPTFAPIAAGRPKPIVPRPPELIQRRGLAKWKYWAVHIWCWPTSEVTIASPPVASYIASIMYCGLISESADRDVQVGLVHGLVGRGRAVQAGDAEPLVVRRRERAEAHDRARDREAV